MKTKIFKVIIMLTISLFLSEGVSMAGDKKGRQHKSNGKAYGYHKKHNDYDHHPSWHKKHHKSYRHRHRAHDHYDRYCYHKGHGYYDRWHKKHCKSHHHRHKHRYCKRYDYYEIHDHLRHYKHNRQEDEFFFEISFNDPYVAVVVGANGD